MSIFANKKSKEEKKAADKTVEVEAQKIRLDKKVSMKELYSDGQKDKVISDKKGEAKSGKKPEKAVAKKGGSAYRVLIKPLVTEKASILGTENKYLFQVSERANKIEIAKAINEIYGIKPESVNVLRVRGKNLRYGRTRGRRKNWKKAVVKLPAGKSINIYEGV